LARLFTPPFKRELPEDVLKDLYDSKIPSMNHLKIRLGNALQKNFDEGVRLHDVWLHLNSFEADQSALACKLNCDVLDVRPINAYKNSKVRYYFSDFESILKIFVNGDKGKFNLIERFIPKYHMGDQFPSIALIKK
jgi:hypothetical protein